MIPLERAALRVVRDAGEEGLRTALVGGLAVSIRAAPRTTRDLDFAVAVSSDAEAERLVHALRGRGYEPYDVLEQVAVGRLATVRFRLALAPRITCPVDLLFASSGIEPEVVALAEELEVLSDLRLPVARRGHLIALKLLSRDDDRRPQDRMDLLALVARATQADLRLAREAAELVRRRGFHRDRDLGAELDRFVRRVEELGGSSS